MCFGIGFLVAGVISTLFHIRLVYINGVAIPRPLIIKPTLLEDDKLNNTQIYTETKIIHISRYEEYRSRLSPDYAAFLTLLMWLTAILALVCLSIGAGLVADSILEKKLL